MKTKLKLGMFGFGCVGEGLYRVLKQTTHFDVEIKKICVRDQHKQRSLPADHFTYRMEDILDDPDIDIVVELIGEADTAFEILRRSLEKGKAVVTANKRMLAEHLEEVRALQLKFGRPVLYEGSVCGSIPILRNLEEYYTHDRIRNIDGIFNGSTNYILTKIFEEKMMYAEALREAQALGFAECDPTLDVSGADAKFKLIITMAHAYGLFVRPEDVICLGIDKISVLDVKYAKDNDLTIKLLARTFREGDRVFGFIAPHFVPNNSAFAQVRNENNVVQVHGAFSERQLFFGKGAGSYPTASAVLSDISALVNDYTYPYKKYACADRCRFSNELEVEALVSFSQPGAVSIRDFSVFRQGYAWQGHQYMIGTLPLTRLYELSQLDGVGLVLTANNLEQVVELEQEEFAAA